MTMLPEVRFATSPVAEVGDLTACGTDLDDPQRFVRLYGTRIRIYRTLRQLPILDGKKPPQNDASASTRIG
jgi:hypothetical protein